MAGTNNQQSNQYMSPDRRQQDGQNNEEQGGNYNPHDAKDKDDSFDMQDITLVNYDPADKTKKKEGIVEYEDALKFETKE